MLPRLRGLNLYPRERLDFGKPLFRSHALATTVNDSVWHIMKQKHITCQTRETRAHLVIVARYPCLLVELNIAATNPNHNDRSATKEFISRDQGRGSNRSAYSPYSLTTQLQNLSQSRPNIRNASFFSSSLRQLCRILHRQSCFQPCTLIVGDPTII